MESCRVVLLDEGEIDVDISNHSIGNDVFTKICKYLNLVETDYFGIIRKTSDSEFRWVKLDKGIKKQFEKGEKLVFHFVVKFYPTDPTYLREEITKYQLCLQIRDDLTSSRLPCPLETLALLSSYWLQSEMGDYETNSGEIDECLRSLRGTKNQSVPDFDAKVMKLYKSRRGMPPGDADTQFLRLASLLPLYGVHRYHATEGTDIGVGAAGVVEIGAKDPTFHKWGEIKNINYKKSKFYLKVLPKMPGGRSTLKKFRMQAPSVAKEMWSIAVDHHMFYRVNASDSTSSAPSTESSPATGPKLTKKRKSSFRFSFRRKRTKTESDVQHESSKIKRPGPTVVRQPSLRRSASLNSSSSKESSETPTKSTETPELKSILKQPKNNSENPPVRSDDQMPTSLLITQTIEEVDEIDSPVSPAAQTQNTDFADHHETTGASNPNVTEDDGNDTQGNEITNGTDDVMEKNEITVSADVIEIGYIEHNTVVIHSDFTNDSDVTECNDNTIPADVTECNDITIPADVTECNDITIPNHVTKLDYREETTVVIHSETKDVTQGHSIRENYDVTKTSYEDKIEFVIQSDITDNDIIADDVINPHKTDDAIGDPQREVDKEAWTVLSGIDPPEINILPLEEQEEQTTVHTSFTTISTSEMKTDVVTTTFPAFLSPPLVRKATWEAMNDYAREQKPEKHEDTRKKEDVTETDNVSTKEETKKFVEIPVFDEDENKIDIEEVGNYTVKENSGEENLKPKNAEENLKPKNAEENLKPKNAEENLEPKSAEENLEPKNAEENLKPKSAEENLKPKSAEENLKFTHEFSNDIESPPHYSSLDPALYFKTDYHFKETNPVISPSENFENFNFLSNSHVPPPIVPAIPVIIVEDDNETISSLSFDTVKTPEFVGPTDPTNVEVVSSTDSSKCPTETSNSFELDESSADESISQPLYTKIEKDVNKESESHNLPENENKDDTLDPKARLDVDKQAIEASRVVSNSESSFQRLSAGQSSIASDEVVEDVRSEGAVLGDDDVTIGDLLDDVMLDDLAENEDESISSLSDITDNTEELCNPNILQIILSKSRAFRETGEKYSTLFGAPLRKNRGRARVSRVKSDIFHPSTASVSTQMPSPPIIEEVQTKRFIPSWPFNPECLAERVELDGDEMALATRELQNDSVGWNDNSTFGTPLHASSPIPDDCATRDVTAPNYNSIPDSLPGIPDFAQSVSLYRLYSSDSPSIPSTPLSPVEPVAIKYPPAVKKFSPNSADDVLVYSKQDAPPLMQQVQAFSTSPITRTTIEDMESSTPTTTSSNDTPCSGRASRSSSTSSFPRFVQSVFKYTKSGKKRRFKRKKKAQGKSHESSKAKSANNLNGSCDAKTNSADLPQTLSSGKDQRFESAQDSASNIEAPHGLHSSLPQSQDSESAATIEGNFISDDMGSIDQIVLSEEDEAHFA